METIRWRRIWRWTPMVQRWLRQVCLLAVVLVFCTVLYKVYVVPLNLSRADAATWVQAVGSIAAILVAVAVPAWLHRESEARAEEVRISEAERIMRMFISLTSDAQYRIKETGDRRVAAIDVDSPETIEKAVQKLSAVRAALKEIPLHMACSATAMTRILRVIELIDQGVKELQRRPQVLPGTNNFASSYVQPLYSIHANLKDHVEYLDWERHLLRKPNDVPPWG